VSVDRRNLLKLGLAGAAGLALAPHAFAGGGGASSQRLTDRVTLISGVGANVLAVAGPEGLVLVDTGTPEQAGALRRELGRTRVSMVINTHWHPEQTGSNEAFGRQGATVLAHERTRQRLSHGWFVRAQDRYVKPLAKAGQPTRSFRIRESLTVGDERVECGHLLEAHTDGDLYVHLRDSNVLAVGDVAASGRDPVIDWFGGGWLGGRIDALETLLKLSNEGTRIVPAQGAVLTRAQLQAEHDVLVGVFTRMAELLRKGYSARDMLDAGVLQGGRDYADPARFVTDAFESLWAHHNTLSPDIV
jgi:glyoxylase-like metal-dependent hydrolase (beta-lactamase superfamily II)